MLYRLFSRRYQHLNHVFGTGNICRGVASIFRSSCHYRPNATTAGGKGLQNTRLLTTSGKPLNHKLDLTGIFPPIATSFDQDENVLFGEISQNVQQWNNIPFRGYVVQGSNGEYVLMSWKERVEMVRRVRQDTPKEKIVLAGSGCQSTTDTIELSRLMAEAGADGVLVITPSYYKSMTTAEGLITHYTKVADSCPVPVVLYSCPPCTGLDLSVDIIVELSKHPNIIGLKDSGGDITKIGHLIHKTRGNDFQTLAGSAGYLLPSLSVGAVGGICGLGNVLGNELCLLQHLFNEGNLPEARSLQHRLIEPNSAVTNKFGIPGLKAAMGMFGLYGGPLRSPLQPVSEADRIRVRNAFSENGFL